MPSNLNSPKWTWSPISSGRVHQKVLLKKAIVVEHYSHKQFELFEEVKASWDKDICIQGCSCWDKDNRVTILQTYSCLQFAGTGGCVLQDPEAILSDSCMVCSVCICRSRIRDTFSASCIPISTASVTSRRHAAWEVRQKSLSPYDLVASKLIHRSVFSPAHSLQTMWKKTDQCRNPHSGPKSFAKVSVPQTSPPEWLTLVAERISRGPGTTSEQWIHQNFC